MYTHTFYDEERSEAYLYDNTYIHQYHMQPPGNGLKLPYINDTNIRLTKWGANRGKHPLQLESHLQNRGNRYTRHYDETIESMLTQSSAISPSVNYPEMSEAWTHYSRTLQPSWQRPIVTIERNFNHLLDDPLKHLRTGPMRIESTQTRIQEKDAFCSI